MVKKPTFEENLDQLEKIVSNLEQGDVPLESALQQFQDGVKLSQTLEKTLNDVQTTLTKVMTDAGEEVDFDTTTQAKDSDTNA